MDVVCMENYQSDLGSEGDKYQMNDIMTVHVLNTSTGRCTVYSMLVVGTTHCPMFVTDHLKPKFVGVGG